MIGFLQPLALLALPLAAVPLVLHLWRRRVPPTVAFPAVRYLEQTTEEHSRRLKLQHLLLLLLRTLLLLVVVLAASRPVVRGPLGGATGGHPPTALAVVLDNSLSSGTVRAGTPTLESLRASALAALGEVTADDHLWLVLADGIPRRVIPSEARAVVDSVAPWPLRLDLTLAVQQAAGALAGDALPAREIHVLSDLQRTALGVADTVPPLTVIAVAPRGEPPANAGVGAATARQPLWGPMGGTVVVEAVGEGVAGAVSMSAAVAHGPEVRAALTPGESVELTLAVPGPGWWVGRVELSPDELLGDNRRLFAVRVAPPARVSEGPGVGPFVAEALAVLRGGGRIAEGGEVRVAESPGVETTLLIPPADPSLLGALNRALASRGVTWRYEPGGGSGLVSDSAVPGLFGAEVRRRYRLVAGGDRASGVLAMVGAEPWLVRDDGVLLLGSRLEEEWTDLPLRPGFLAALDHLLNLAARGEAARLSAAPGAAVSLPDRVTGLDVAGARRTVEPGATLAAPREPGVYFLLAGGDTAGTLAVNPDPRESILARASREEVRRALGRDARVVDADGYASARFAAVRRAEVSGLFLVAALLLAAAETLVARRLTGSES